MKSINMQGKPCKVSLLNLEESKVALLLSDKSKGKEEVTIIYLDSDQVSIQGLPQTQIRNVEGVKVSELSRIYK